MDQDFLQSTEWLLFQKASGKEVFNLSQNNYIAKIIKRQLPLVGSYFYLPRGPYFKKKDQKTIKSLLKNLFNLAYKNKINWIRVEPLNEKELSWMQKKSAYTFKKAPTNVQPQQTLRINIEQALEHILANMKPKTRYNIRLAQKKELEIKKISKIETNSELVLFNQFWQLIQKTSKRQKIKSHPYNYYKQMLESLPLEMKTLYLAKHNNKIIAGILVIFYKKTAIYLHGAFDDNYRSLMAPFLLHWKAIQRAQEEKYQWYDLGGVRIIQGKEKLEAQKGSWEGITRFKLGFSKKPKIITYPGTYDIILKKKPYNFYRIIQKIKVNLV